MLMTLLVFAATILVLVGLHEAGHFFVAKAFGVYIKEFAIGFGPKLFSIPGKETKYSLRLIPFGGYVRMAGEDRQETDESIPGDRHLYSKPPWARALISLAGPIANLLLAFVVILIVFWSSAFPILQVSGILPASPAEATLQFGDQVLSINGRTILEFADLTNAIQRSNGDSITMTVVRDGEKRDVVVQPAYVPEEDRYVVGAYFLDAAYTTTLESVAEDSLLGSNGLQPGDTLVAIDDVALDGTIGSLIALTEEIDPSFDAIVLSYERAGESATVELPATEQLLLELFSGTSYVHLGIETRSAGLGVSIAKTAGQFVAYIHALADLVRNLISGQAGASEAISGPVGIAQLLGEGIRIGLGYFFQLLAFLSLNFGLLNLVPFPALDGSRVAFALYEWVRGKPIRPEREGIIHAIGFLILIGLMILITYRDIARLFQ